MVQDNTGSGTIVIGHIIAACLRRWPIVLAIAILLSGAAYTVLRHLPPSYSATSFVWVGKRDARIISSESAWSTVDQPAFGHPEQGRVMSAVLTSMPVLRRVVLALDLHNQPQAVRSRIDIFVANLREQVGLSADAAGSGRPYPDASAPTSAGYEIAATDPVSLVDAPQKGGGGAAGLVQTAGPAGQAGAPRTRSEEGAIRGAVAALASNLDVVVDTRSEVAAITYSATDPEIAAKVVNEIPRAYAAERQARLQAGTSGAVDWLSERVEVLRADVVDAEEALKSFKARNGLTGSSGDTDQRLERLVEAIDTAETQAAEARRRLERARAETDSADVDTTLFGSSVMQQLMDMRADAVRERRELLTRVDPQHALVAVVERRLDGIDEDILRERARMVREFEADAERRERAVESARAELEAARSSLTDEAVADAETASRLAELEAEATAARALYTNMLSRLNDARQVAELDTSGISIIQRALTPQQPSGIGPLPLVAAVGMGTLFLGFGVVAGLSIIDRRIAHASQLTPFGFRDVISAPLVDKLPTAADKPRERKGRSSRQSRGWRSRLLFDEAIRRVLATTLYEPREDGHGGRVLLVTSGAKHEGKTTVASAVAAFAAVSGTSTVLVEADLRRPGHFATNVPAGNNGLVGLLQGEQTLGETLVRARGSGAHVVPTTTTVQHSTELLASPRMRALIEELRQRYAFVVIDTPPVCLTPDPEVLAPYADDIVVVIRHRDSTVERTARAVDFLERRSAASLIGFVNMTDLDFFDEYYGPGDHLYAFTPVDTRDGLGALKTWATSRLKGTSAGARPCGTRSDARS